MKTGKWSKEEEQFLIENVTKISMKELINALNRSDGSIRAKKTLLGITSEKNKPFTENEKQIIKEWYEKYGDEIDLDELSIFLGRQKTSICRHARKLGLTDQSRISTKNKQKARESLLNYFETDEWKETSKKGQQMLTDRSRNNHFKGMLGKHHTTEVKRRMSISHKIEWENKTEYEKQLFIDKMRATKRKNNQFTNTENSYSRCKGGFREDLNQYFRSKWEANIARYFNFLDIIWEYEPKRFHFEEIESGVLSYMPDFYLPQLDIWIEVKGWMDEKSKLRLEYFKKFYPEYYNKLILVDEKKYYEIESDFKYIINNWELKQSKKAS